MNEGAPVALRRILLGCAAVEVGTGIALMIAPAFVAALLVSAPVTQLATLLGRCMGVALLALGVACWPERQGAVSGPAFRAMLAYSALIALLLGFVGAVAGLGGPLLWPAVVLHAAAALLLAWFGRQGPPSP